MDKKKVYLALEHAYYEGDKVLGPYTKPDMAKQRCEDEHKERCRTYEREHAPLEWDEVEGEDYYARACSVVDTDFMVAEFMLDREFIKDLTR